MIQTFSDAPRRLGNALMLRDAIEGYLSGVASQQRQMDASFLDTFERYLGAPAPLLAYTHFTGESWLKTLAPHDQPFAKDVLGRFRTYLRDAGWLEAARPVNQFD